jgi:hypothetical protein
MDEATVQAAPDIVKKAFFIVVVVAAYSALETVLF